MAENEIAPIVLANSLVLGQVCGGTVVDAYLLHALDDPRTAFVNIRTASPGCLLSAVEQIPACLSQHIPGFDQEGDRDCDKDAAPNPLRPA